MAVDHVGFIRPLPGIVFSPVGFLATLLTRQGQWGSGLVADSPTMKQVVLDYMLPVAPKRPDQKGFYTKNEGIPYWREDLIVYTFFPPAITTNLCFVNIPVPDGK